MKVTITHLKAPWPTGAGVGSVVEFTAGAVPECFVNKCMPAAEDAEAGFVYPAPAAEVAADPAEADPAAAALAAADEQHAAEVAADPAEADPAAAALAAADEQHAAEVAATTKRKGKA
jgi:hypothetical protein